MADRVGVAIEGETEGETEGRGLFRGTRRRIPTWWCDDVYWFFFVFTEFFFLGLHFYFRWPDPFWVAFRIGHSR